ncbi:response regulator, partial [Sediminibacterium sp.]|uniref:response regulator n=1 Tax=Sediminibacterium sp. TaxID=1917865 RepID=UPI003F6A469B
PEDIWIRIEVKDSGIGIPEVKIDSLFQPYQQADTAISRKYGGTGLGLSIVKNLVSLMGGRIGVESKIDSGSIFSIQLPFKTNTESTKTAYPIADHNQLKGLRVLLAEDVEMNQFIARSILEEKGVYVTEAIDGRETIEKVKSFSFDLILMDISMPYIDGIQATSIIRSMKNSPNCSIPIIAITANALEGDKQKYLSAGMNGYISKPFLEEEFLMVILQCLQKNDFCFSSDNENLINPTNEKLYSEAHLMGMGKYQQTFIDKMIGLFLQTMPEDIYILQETAKMKDWKKVERTAHRIKSAIRSMGIQSAIQAIRYIEEAAQKNPPPDDIVQKIDWVSQAMKLVIDQIKADYPHIAVSK